MVKRDRNFARLIRLKISQIDAKAQVILYGSCAWEEAKESADWDILILTDYDTDLKKENQPPKHTKLLKYC